VRQTHTRLRKRRPLVLPEAHSRQTF
jgi:hypothetical protein